MLLKIINMVIIARLLTPAEVGMFVIALSLVTMLQALREMGLTNYLIREPVLQDSSIRTIFGMSIVLCSVIALILFALRHPLEGWFGAPGLADVLVPIVLVILIFPIEQPAMALIRRDMRFEALHHITLASKFVSVLTSIGLAFMGFSTMALVWGLVVEAVLRTVFLAYAERRPLSMGPSLESWRLLLGFGSWMTGASIAAQASSEGTKLLVGGLLGPAATGLYDRAVRVPGMIGNAIIMPVSRVVLSSFSEDVRQRRPLGGKVAHLIGVTIGLTWPVYALLGVLAHELILLMLGPQWTQAAVILPWLLASQMIISGMLQPDQILVPYGKVRLLFVTRMIQLVLSLGLGLVALYWSLEAFAVSRLINAVLNVVITWVVIAPHLDLRAADLGRLYMRTLLLCAVSLSPVALWKYADLGDGSIPVLLACLVAAGLLGLITLHLLRHPLMAELTRAGKMISGKIRKRPVAPT